MYKKISDYGIIGNLHSVALIGKDGSIDWMCLPHIDSPSVFGAVLDDEKGGRFSIAPVGMMDSMAEYIPETNILRTIFRTRKGEMELTDFMPIPIEGREGREEQHELFRRIIVTKGNVEVGMIFDPRFNYARTETSLTRKNRMLIVRGGTEIMTLAVSQKIPESRGEYTAQWSLSAKETLWFRLQYNTEESFICNTEIGEKALHETEGFWREWLRRRETGRSVRLGHYQAMVDRSALILKLLQFEETGTIAAAATTSLPEEVGGSRNWDYRYTWLRDASFTLQALFNLGHLSETESYLRWIERLILQHGAEKLQVMYGLRGEEDLPESELTHLDGYKSSRPVRIGNKATQQKQLDVYGEIMDAALRLSDYVGKISYTMWPVLRDICDHVAGHWQEDDSGIWEIRGGPSSFVHSKVMCWVALDRGITIAQRYGFPANLEKWKATTQKIREEVLRKGWSDKKKSFVQHYGSEALDASSLLIPLYGFLPFKDPLVIHTVEAIERELSHNGFLFRYRGGDGLAGDEGAFLLCSFWLVDCFIGLDRLSDAELLLRKLENTANHLGLFSEEYDVRWLEPLGNVPQAFTHIGYINSVIKLLEAKGELYREERDKKKLSLWERLVSKKIVLNVGEPRQPLPSKEIALSLKNSMNVLRGAFFDTAHSRVAYEKMKGSDAYEAYLALSYSLRTMRLDDLLRREEKIAFWINLFNVIVIHAVIELDIRDSIKEVRNFFRRVCYQVGDMQFTPFEIEHGILRGNRRPPHGLRRTFHKGDLRLHYSIEPIDPRVHFALVCASSSCPPIDVYTEEHLDEELDISGRTFINAGGIIIDRDSGIVLMSRIFKWYAQDFGETKEEMIKFIVPYLYKEDDRLFLEKNAKDLQIEYQDYDWRLNRY